MVTGGWVCERLWWSVCGSEREFIGAASFLHLMWVVLGSNPNSKIRRRTDIGTGTLATTNLPSTCEKLIRRGYSAITSLHSTRKSWLAGHRDTTPMITVY